MCVEYIKIVYLSAVTVSVGTSGLAARSVRSHYVSQLGLRYTLR
jgi:hypothetical protein